MTKVNLMGLLGLVIAALVAVGLYAVGETQKPGNRGYVTVAEVQAAHAAVLVDGRPHMGIVRLVAGSRVSTDAAGRARIRLDNGASIVVDGGTELLVGGDQVELKKGRFLLQGDAQRKTRVKVDEMRVSTLDGVLGVELRDGKVRVFCANGEATVSGGKAKGVRISSGESATLASGKVKVSPEIAYEDWTGGLTRPWSADGTPKLAVGQLWGKLSLLGDGEAGKPFTIRATDVLATVRREVATTRVRTTYFNAGSRARHGEFRMPIPSNAVVTGVYVVRDGQRKSLRVVKQASTEETYERVGRADVLVEWAGEGQIHGLIPPVDSGSSVTISVEYEQWLEPRDGKLVYRLPLIGDVGTLHIGEFLARVVFEGATPREMSANLGATIEGNAVVLKKSDFMPSADLVVEATPSFSLSTLRTYREDGARTEANYAVFRYTVPASEAPSGVSLAVVMDDSASMSPSRMEIARDVVATLVRSLGKNDRVVVVAADQSTRFLGPNEIGPADEKRRSEIVKALDNLRPGGATDMSRALLEATSLLPPKDPSAMVVYVGDGWATTGVSDVEKLRALLAQRSEGLPRMAVLATGNACNLSSLALMVRGLGPVYHVPEREKAGDAVSRLLSKALQPMVSNVSMVFPSNFEWTYPVRPVHVPAGGTFTAVGRFRGRLADSVLIRWRGKDGPREEKIRVSSKFASRGVVQRKWAKARLEELGYLNAGREAVQALGTRYGLLTPWTAWVGSNDTPYVPSLAAKQGLLEDMEVSSPFLAHFFTPASPFGALEDLIETPADDDEELPEQVRRSVQSASQRVLQAARARFRACARARMAVRPGLDGVVSISLKVNVDGSASDIEVTASGDPSDDTLSSCFRQVVSGLKFPVGVADGAVEVSYSYRIVGRRRVRGRKCSPTSRLPLGLRRGVWMRRLGEKSPFDVYVKAKRQCELKAWADKRALLELVFGKVANMPTMVRFARRLQQIDEDDAAKWVKTQALRRANSPDVLKTIRRMLLEGEVLPTAMFRKKYEQAKTDEQRLAVVRKFMQVAPHHPALRRLHIILLRSMGKRDELENLVADYRDDPLSDAAVLSEGASALLDLDAKREATRTFGEMVERAPRDPYVRAFLGDQLLAHGLSGDAIQAFEVLDKLTPDLPSSLMRLSLAYKDAGRFDIALRTLEHLARTGGRTGDVQQARLAERLAVVWLQEALSDKQRNKQTKELLLSRVRRLRWQRPGTLVVLRAPRTYHAVRMSVVPAKDKQSIEQGEDLAMSQIGLHSVALSEDLAEQGLELRVQTPKRLPPVPRINVTIYVVHGPSRLEDSKLLVWRGPIELDGERHAFSVDGLAIKPL